MPLIIDKQTKEDARILIWKSEEPLDFFSKQTLLTQSDYEKLEKYNSERRKMDLLVARFLLQKHCKNAIVAYLENGKPYLENQYYKISISHSKDIVAVILHTNKDVSIDVEYIDNKIERLKTRFLSQFEIEQADSVEKQILFWSAKETLFKIDHKQGFDIKTELSLNFHGDKLIGKIRNEDKFDIEYQINSEWVLTYIVS